MFVNAKLPLLHQSLQGHTLQNTAFLRAEVIENHSMQYSSVQDALHTHSASCIRQYVHTSFTGNFLKAVHNFRY